jgi:hypothetical protein
MDCRKFSRNLDESVDNKLQFEVAFLLEYDISSKAIRSGVSNEHIDFVFDGREEQGV